MALTVNTTGFLTRVTDASTTTGWSALGGGQSGLSVDTDVAVQGGDAISKKVSGTNVKGMWYDNGSGIDFSSNGDHIYIWVLTTKLSVLENRRNGGIRIRLGTSTSNYSEWYMDGKETYAGGWVRYVIDPTSTASGTGGTGLDTTSVQFMGALLSTTGAVQGTNFFIDAIDYGKGLQVEGLDSDGWNDIFVEDNDVANKYGIIEKRGGVFFLKGRIEFGDDTGTNLLTFLDQDRVIVFENPLYFETDDLNVAGAVFQRTIFGPTIDSYNESNQDSNQKIGNGTTQEAGQSFLGDGTEVTGAEVFIREVGTTTNFASGSIYASTGTDPNRTPTGLPLATTDVVDMTGLGSTYGLQKFRFGLPFTALSATTYFFVLSYSQDGSNHIEWGTDTSSPGHTSNNFATFSGSWTAPSTTDGCFHVHSEAFVDITTPFNNATTNDTNPFPTTESIGDEFYVGYINKFSRITVDSTGGVSGTGGQGKWEYWNGVAWTEVSGLDDGSNVFKASVGVNIVTWDTPIDLTQLSVNGSTLYWIRLRLTSGYSTNPVLDTGTVDTERLSPAVNSSLYRIDVVGNATGATLFQDGIKVGSGDTATGRNGSVINSAGPAVIIDFDDGNVNTLKMYGTSFTGISSGITFGTNTAHEFIGCAINGSGQVETGSVVVRDCTFVGTTDVDAAILWNESINIKASNFISNTLGAAVEHPSNAGTPYSHIGLKYSGNTFDVLNSAGAAITIDNTGGADGSTSEGSAVTFQTAISLNVTVQDTATDPIENAQVAIYKTSDRTQLMNEDTLASGLASESYSGGATDIEIRVRKASTGSIKYRNFSTLGTTTTSDFNLLVTLVVDPINAT